MNEVKIGDQIWMQENLNVAAFRNGANLLEAKNQEDWLDANKKKKAAWCYYNFDVTNEKFGKLYNWYAINDPRGLAPDNWKIPSDQDWDQLDKYIVIGCPNSSDRGNKLKSKEGWNKEGNGTDDFCFNALPGGFCTSDGQFDYIGDCANWWSASEYNNKESWKAGLINLNGAFVRMASNKKCGYSVRCLKA
jgi:uncharacterized protein (TIGR02145 family)